ncbi:hypothetical protein PMAC_000789 [Pneumocystis sp. 'macacae']|nr:hypothetical protein PMAC_000789 [Pneumocystis sp. 'macacae']
MSEEYESLKENEQFNGNKTYFGKIIEEFRYTDTSSKHSQENNKNKCYSTKKIQLQQPSIKRLQIDVNQNVDSLVQIVHRNKRKRRTNRSYVPPEHYAHLPSGVPDVLGENLIVMFIGLNPGIATVKAGHAFAGPTNLFWKLLHSSQIVSTETRLRPEDDVTLQKWDVGITNLVSRPTAGSNELSREEMIENVPILEKKVSTFCPLSVCIVGKGIYEAIYRYKTGKSLKKTFEWGWQPERMGVSENYEGALVYVVPSTSGRAASYSKEMKEKCWNIFGEWVAKKRKERNKSKDILNES